MPLHLLLSEAIKFRCVNPVSINKIHLFSSALTLPLFRSSLSHTGICTTVSYPLFLLLAYHHPIQSFQTTSRVISLEKKSNHVILKVLYETFSFSMFLNSTNKVLHNLILIKCFSLIYLPPSYWNSTFLPPRVLTIP